MLDPFDLEVVSEQLQDIFSSEVIPSWTILVAETYQEIHAFGLQNRMNLFDEGYPFVNLHMMKTAEIKLFILEGETQKNS